MTARNQRVTQVSIFETGLAVDFSAYAMMGAALAMGALVKGATGMGLPLIALPALTAVFGLQHAVVLLLVPTLITNAWQVWRFRSVRAEARLRFLPMLVLGGAFGVVVGTWLLVSVPERQLQFALGLLLFAYVLLRVTRPALTIEERPGRVAALPVGVGAGVLQGATGISAPLGVTFIHAMGMDRDAHVYAVSAMFLGFTMVQVVALGISGVLQAEWLLQGAAAMIPILLFMPLGQWLAGKLSAKAFDRLILFFLAVIGAKLLAGI